MTTQKRADRKTLGCYKPSSPATPETVKNRPGLSSIRYRVGTYASFRQAMLELITQGELYVDGTKIEPYPLANWSSRRSDDYGIAILEMWAYLADILTFYQERIANEAFLGTAQQPESLAGLAKMLYYQPAPGKAASAWLAFTLEDGASVKIPKELKVQSVPGQDEKPQKFETVEAITADAKLNRVRIYPKPQNCEALAAGSKEGILDPTNANTIVGELAPGDRLVMFFTSEAAKEAGSKQALLEEKVVEKTELVDWYTRLIWSPAMTVNLANRQVYRWVRKFRVFGHNAPETQLKGEIKKKASLALNWTERETEFEIKSTDKTLELDGLYDELQAGTPILVVATDPDNKLFLVKYIAATTAVRQVVANVMAKETNPAEVVISGTATQIDLGEKLGEKLDRRRISVYELKGPEIKFWNYKYGSLKKNIDTFFVAKPKFKSLDKDLVLILDDTKQAPQTVTVTSGASSVTETGVEHLKITFTPALKNGLDRKKAVFYGNAAKATHGETVAKEVLGSGNAATAFQRFTLKKYPVTHVPAAKATYGASNTLEVRVDGVRWKQKATLYGQGSKARVYTTEVDEDGAMSVRFGDGITGARLTSGRNNITAKYRQGIGKKGQVKATTLTNLLDRPKGLKGVTNPAGAWGAADPENRARIRKNAPNSVRTFDRIVSLRDFEDAARAYSGVAKARASLIYRAGNSVVELTVAGDDGTELAPATIKQVRAYLDARRDPNRLLEIAVFKNVYVVVKALLYVDSDYAGNQVQTQALLALQKHFAFADRDLGQPVHLSDIHQVLQSVTGVAGVRIDRLRYKEKKQSHLVHTEHGLAYKELQVHLSVFTSEIAAIDKKAIVLPWETAP